MSTVDMINEYDSEQMTCCSECDDYLPNDEMDSLGKCSCCSTEYHCIGCGVALVIVGNRGDDKDPRYAIWECPSQCDGWLKHIALLKQADECSRKQRQTLSEAMQCLTNTAIF